MFLFLEEKKQSEGNNSKLRTLRRVEWVLAGAFVTAVVAALFVHGSKDVAVLAGFATLVAFADLIVRLRMYYLGLLTRVTDDLSIKLVSASKDFSVTVSDVDLADKDSLQRLASAVSDVQARERDLVSR